MHVEFMLREACFTGWRAVECVCMCVQPSAQMLRCTLHAFLESVYVCSEEKAIAENVCTPISVEWDEEWLLRRSHPRDAAGGGR